MKKTSISRYVVVNEDHGYFFNSKQRTPQYNENDFVQDVTRANHYISWEGAFMAALQLYPTFHTKVALINIVITEYDEVVKSIDEWIREQIAACKHITNEVANMSPTEVETLPKQKWEHYKKCRDFIRKYDGNVE